MLRAMSETRSHAPTVRRLQEAAAHGDLGVSRLVPAAVVLATAVYWAQAGLARLGEVLANILRQGLGGVGSAVPLTSQAAAMLAAVVAAVAPLCALCFAAALVAGLAQWAALGGARGGGSSSRASGGGIGAQLRAMVSPRRQLGLAWRVCALVLLGSLCVVVWAVGARGLLAIGAADLPHLLRSLGRLLAYAPGWAAGGFAVLALADLWVERSLRVRALRMGHDALRRERRDMEGDPAVAARTRQLARASAQAAGLSEVTHAALLVHSGQGRLVALHDPQGAEGPRTALPTLMLTAQGPAGQRLQGAARAAGVPVVLDEPLLAQLWALQPGAVIPRASFAAVAGHLRAGQVTADG